MPAACPACAVRRQLARLEAELQEAQGINNQLIADVASTTLPVVEALRAELEAEKKKNLEKSKRSCTLKENLKKLILRVTLYLLLLELIIKLQMLIISSFADLSLM